MNREEFMSAAEGAMSDETPIQIEITIADIWFLISSCQLTVRHPELHDPLKLRLRQICDQLATAIIQRRPETATVLAMGWDPEQDNAFGDYDDEDESFGAAFSRLARRDGADLDPHADDPDIVIITWNDLEEMAEYGEPPTIAPEDELPL